MSVSTAQRESKLPEKRAYYALFFGPVAYVAGGYGILYLFRLPDASIAGLLWASLLGAGLGLLLCAEAWAETSPGRGGAARRPGTRRAGQPAGRTEPAEVTEPADAAGERPTTVLGFARPLLSRSARKTSERRSAA
jgi:hypothetical protein